MASQQFNILKQADSGDQITVWGVVYPSMRVDTQKDGAEPGDVEKACHQWMAKGIVKNIDIYHERQKIDAAVVENFFTRKGDPDFPQEQWVVAVQINDADVCDAVRKGELNGFSLDGEAFSETVIAKVIHPVKSIGTTELSLDEEPFPPHTHDADVAWNDDGRMIPTFTGVTFAHKHEMKSPTATGITADHAHRTIFDNEGNLN